MKKHSVFYLLKIMAKDYTEWRYYNKLVTKFNKAKPEILVKFKKVKKNV